eukprot:scaffold1017_cov374-Prasinococcus_capsulatus_cf.AAC.23
MIVGSNFRGCGPEDYLASKFEAYVLSFAGPFLLIARLIFLERRVTEIAAWPGVDDLTLVSGEAPQIRLQRCRSCFPSQVNDCFLLRNDDVFIVVLKASRKLYVFVCEVHGLHTRIRPSFQTAQGFWPGRVFIYDVSRMSLLILLPFALVRLPLRCVKLLMSFEQEVSPPP